MKAEPAKRHTGADAVPVREFASGGVTHRMIDLPAVLGPDLQRLPFALRLLTESVCRHEDPATVGAAIDALRGWRRDGPSAHSIDLMPDRLLMHDTTSTPALVDLAAMRDVLADRGVDPGQLTPVLPVEVSVDHWPAVQVSGRPHARAINEALEIRRNAERFSFLKSASGAMPTVNVNPPGTGIMHTMNLEQFSRSQRHCRMARAPWSPRTSCSAPTATPRWSTA